MEYKIIWEIDVEADNEKDAVIKARQIQQDHESIATIFKVKPLESNEDFKSIDSSEFICPICGGDGEYLDTMEDGFAPGYFYSEIECDKCNTTWNAHYKSSTTFTGIDEITTPNDETDNSQ